MSARASRTPEILSALESSPGATDQQIADELGVTRQRVAQVRRAQHGARPAGRPRKGEAAGVKYTLRIPPEIRAYLEERLYPGETLGELLLAGGMERARPRAPR